MRLMIALGVGWIGQAVSKYALVSKESTDILGIIFIISFSICIVQDIKELFFD